MAAFNVKALKTKKDVAKLGGARLRELELSLDIEPDGGYEERVENCWEVIAAVRAAEDDDEKPEGDEDGDYREADASDMGLVKGKYVNHDEYGKCVILKVYDDLQHLKLMTAEDGEVFRNVPLDEIVPVKVRAKPAEDEDEDDEKPAKGKKGKKPAAEDEDDDDAPPAKKDDPILDLAHKLNKTPAAELAAYLHKLQDEEDVDIVGVFDALPEPQKRRRTTALNGKKGNGVSATIVRLLTEEATKKNPLTKEELHARLMEEMPDADERSTMSTVNKIPWTLVNMGPKIAEERVHRRKNAEGKMAYWITPED